MSALQRLSQLLEKRRRELGMSRPLLAKRSGVSLPTVHRILNGPLEHRSMANTVAVAEALGVEVKFAPVVDSLEYQEREAKAKAQQLVGLVQGSSGLEAQAVDSETARRMVSQTVHELMAGPRRRIWTPM